MKTKYKRAVFLVVLLASLVIYAGDAAAIPPPDIARVGSIMIQLLSVFFVLGSTAAFFLRKKLKVIISRIGWKWIFSSLTILCLVGIAAFLMFKPGAKRPGESATKNMETIEKTASKELSDKTRSENKSASVQQQGIAVKESTDKGRPVHIDQSLFTVHDKSLAIPVDEAVKLLGNPEYLYIDVREPVEFGVRHIPGFVNMRYGDLIYGGTYKTLDKNKKIMFICGTGERSILAASFLKQKGFYTRAAVSGVVEWTMKGYSTTGSSKTVLPEFRNKYKIVKIDRRQLRELQRNGNILLVDVRSTAEFQKSHIDGSYNIPLMNLPWQEVEAAISRLPKDKPVIGLAYDRFGNFYTQVLGYLLGQRGYNYGGRIETPEKLT
jgi:rhodanese-related sulfurtransferase